MTRAPKKGLTGHFGTTSYLFNYETVSEMMKQGQTAAGKIADGPYAKLPTDAGKIADGPYAKLPTVEGGVNNIGSIEVELENPNGGEVLNSESDTNTKTENPPARAALHRSQRLKVTRADLDLGYTVKAYTKNLYRRERGIGFKLLANELREFERLERAEGNWRIRAALVGYLRDDDQANIDSNWEMGYFLKHWELSDASLDAMADMEAMMRESRIAEADSGQGAISTGGDGMQIPPDSAKGLKRPRALYQWYVDRWNELAPSARVKSAEAYRHEEAFQDNDLVGFWDDVCERVEQEYRIAEKNPGFWLTLDWILSNKNGRPNWRGLLARKPKMKESDVIGEALFGRQS